jgi:hypothetical protein
MQLRDKSPPSNPEMTHFPIQAIHRSRHRLETAPNPGTLDDQSVSFLANKYHVCVSISYRYYDSEIVVDNISQFRNRYNKSTPILAINSSCGNFNHDPSAA